ncbi:MAG: lysine--tRNA ligase [Elusimicrobia bacterium]|nr:lysine--tRNA ligase [Elusimicrobiota bacterium]
MNSPQIAPQNESWDQNTDPALIQNKKEKLLKIKSLQINPFPAKDSILQKRVSTLQIKEQFKTIEKEESEENVHLCGRMIRRRDMGKASFAHIQDFYGQLQIYVRQDLLGEPEYEMFSKNFDLGDILSVEGKMFRTKTGELSLKAKKIVLLAKSLRPLPEKWHGLKDIELCYRYRELDLISNPESRTLFEMRAKIIQSLRSLLYKEGYLEVETPMIQALAGGAVARPFETFHHALNQKFYLRIAPELYLKRCLVGGFEKVFELGRVFRNEGIDTLHNPEFTILEAYEAYGNMESMMELTQKLILETAKNVSSPNLNLLKTPFESYTIGELFQKHVGSEEAIWVKEQNWKKFSEKYSNEFKEIEEYKIFDRLFSEKIAQHLVNPTFVTEFPADFSPLAKCKEGSTQMAERFELYIQGEELANAYSELNDPMEQKLRIEKYRELKLSQNKTKKENSAQSEEGVVLDNSFIESLEIGMPPAGGLGIGVDRLVMFLTGQNSIRNVLLFPTLKS